MRTSACMENAAFTAALGVRMCQRHILCSGTQVRAGGKTASRSIKKDIKSKNPDKIDSAY